MGTTKYKSRSDMLTMNESFYFPPMTGSPRQRTSQLLEAWVRDILFAPIV